jgi:hypothetical protein
VLETVVVAVVDDMGARRSLRPSTEARRLVMRALLSLWVGDRQLGMPDGVPRCWKYVSACRSEDSVRDMAWLRTGKVWSLWPKALHAWPCQQPLALAVR